MVVTALYDTVSKRRQEEHRQPGDRQQARKTSSFAQVLTEEQQKMAEKELEGRTIGYDKDGMMLFYQMARREYR